MLEKFQLLNTLFVTGTGTNVGKTFISAQILNEMNSLGKKTAYYKPLQTGCENASSPDSDMSFIQKNCPATQVFNSYTFKLPACPQLAAKEESKIIDLNLVKQTLRELHAQFDFVLVEGAGGLLVPIDEAHAIKDLIKLLNIPVLVVSSNELGCINHSLLTLENLRDFTELPIYFFLNSYNSQNSHARVIESNYEIILEHSKKLNILTV
jgi:dethiobiotin synthetase